MVGLNGSVWLPTASGTNGMHAGPCGPCLLSTVLAVACTISAHTSVMGSELAWHGMMGGIARGAAGLGPARTRADCARAVPSFAAGQVLTSMRTGCSRMPAQRSCTAPSARAA